jgi:two-component system phosphate regulon sensor histidine kinase PhoR
MFLPFWILVPLSIGFAFGIYEALKKIAAPNKKKWQHVHPAKKTSQSMEEKTRRDFVANVSHELRTPVSIIKGFADSILNDYETLNDSRRKDFLSKIQKNAERLNSLVEELLLLAKLEKPEATIQKEDLDLCELVKNIREDFCLQQKGTAPPINLKFPVNPVTISADPEKLVRVFENLLHNATIHAEGLTKIVVKIEEPAGQNFIICEIEDDGNGVSQEDQTMLFERFYRVDKGRSRQKGGTGLGLSIGREIIEAHGGEISVRSQKGEGTIFSLKLPRQTSTAI